MYWYFKPEHLNERAQQEIEAIRKGAYNRVILFIGDCILYWLTPNKEIKVTLFDTNTERDKFIAFRVEQELN